MEGRQEPPQVQGLGGDLSAVAFQPQVLEQSGELLHPGGFQLREALAEELLQVFLGDDRHIQHHEAGNQGLVQLPGAGIAVVHGADEPGGGVQGDAPVAGDVDDPAEVQGGVEDGQGLIFGHVHLVQHAEASQPGALADGALPEGHLPVLEGVRPDEGGGVHIDIHGHIPGGAAEGGGQILRQHVFARGLRAGQEQVLPAQQGGGRPLPDLLAIVEEAGTGHPSGGLRRGGVGVPEGPDLLQQAGVHPLLLQFLPNIHSKPSLG